MRHSSKAPVSDSHTVESKFGKGEVLGANVGMHIDAWFVDQTNLTSVARFLDGHALHKYLLHRRCADGVPRRRDTVHVVLVDDGRRRPGQVQFREEMGDADQFLRGDIDLSLISVADRSCEGGNQLGHHKYDTAPHNADDAATFATQGAVIPERLRCLGAVGI